MRYNDFLNQMERIARSVYEFHECFGIPQVVSIYDHRQLGLGRQRLLVLMEELGEIAGAVNRGQVDQMNLELADLLFATIGSILIQGDAGLAACATVVKKNDAKNERTHRYTPGGKVVRREESGD